MRHFLAFAAACLCADMAVGQTPACDAYEKCSFGNCEFRQSVLNWVQNTPSIPCSHPVSQFVGQYEIVDGSPSETVTAVDRVRQACGFTYLAPQCDRVVPKTETDSILLAVAYIVSGVRLFQIAGLLRRHGLGIRDASE